MDNIEAAKIAERALEKLLELQASPSPSIKDLKAVADDVRAPPGSEGSAANQARVEAWLAVRKVVRTLEGNNPDSNDLPAFWRRAIDMTHLWRKAVDG